MQIHLRAVQRESIWVTFHFHDQYIHIHICIYECVYIYIYIYIYISAFVSLTNRSRFACYIAGRNDRIFD